MTRVIKRAFPKLPAKAAIIESYIKPVSDKVMWKLIADLDKAAKDHPAHKFCRLRKDCEAFKDAATGGCHACQIGSAIKEAYESGQTVARFKAEHGET